MAHLRGCRTDIIMQKILTKKYKYIAFLHVPSLSAPNTFDLPSRTNQAGACGLQTFGHPSGSSTDWDTYLLFPAISYLLSTSAGNRSPRITKCESHKHTLFCWESCFTGALPNPPQKKNPAGWLKMLIGWFEQTWLMFPNVWFRECSH